MTAPTPAARLIEADRHAASTRQRLSSTVAELQGRLEPSRLAEEALTEVRAAGSASIAAAGRHRGPLIGAAAAIGLFLARRPILRLFRPSPERATEPDPPR